jgi:hypothetical protein
MSCDYIIVVAVRIISSSTLNFYLRMAGTAIKTTLSAHRKIVRFFLLILKRNQKIINLQPPQHYKSEKENSLELVELPP